MRKLRITWIMISLLVGLSMLLAACSTPTTAPTTAAGETPAASGSTLAVGIVLPTKDEPRWIQDETRFKEALQAAGYDVEILFAQGSSAKEKENVEVAVDQRRKSSHHLPAGRHRRCCSR